VLVVDDNIFNVVTLQTILEFTHSLRSDKATNGKEAVDLVRRRLEMDQRNPCICPLRRSNYKLIFMDCNMPIMDGFQATQEIRKMLPPSTPVCIAALTAYTTENFKEKTFASGMDYFLTKPVCADTVS
jgi:two-component system, sensor histidine kinase